MRSGQDGARRWVPTARRRVAAQDLRIGTLNAARNYSVPFANLFRRVELKVRSFYASKLLNQTLGFFGDKAVSLKS